MLLSGFNARTLNRLLRFFSRQPPRTGASFLIALGITAHMLQKRPISAEQALYGGTILVVLSLIYISLVLFRFQWLLRFALARVLLRWGRASWSFPASRLGAFTGGIVVFTAGLILMDVYFRVFPARLFEIRYSSSAIAAKLPPNARWTAALPTCTVPFEKVTQASSWTKGSTACQCCEASECS